MGHVTVVVSQEGISTYHLIRPVAPVAVGAVPEYLDVLRCCLIESVLYASGVRIGPFNVGRAGMAADEESLLEDFESVESTLGGRKENLSRSIRDIAIKRIECFLREPQ